MKEIAFIIDTNPNYNAICREMYPAEKIENEVESVLYASVLKEDNELKYNTGMDRAVLTDGRIIKSKLK